ncbi:hypothetical protein F5Y14DRAFT_462231 [Nemania sp. NC0429]|nr:hypothetical protein F5Y14DRAFT_462231 [Nemania sp. NC0429]
MLFPALLLASILAIQATSTPIDTITDTEMYTNKDTAIPAPLALTNRKWTLSNLTRKRSNKSTTCRWRFKVTDTTPAPSPLLIPGTVSATADGDGDGDGGNLPPVRCNFKTNTTKKGFDCGLEDFEPVKCSRSNASYLVSGAHEKFGGFFMMLVSNVDAGLRAYFLFDEALLEAGEELPTQTVRVQNDMVPPLRVAVVDVDDEDMEDEDEDGDEI